MEDAMRGTRFEEPTITAMFFAETRNHAEVMEIEHLAEDLARNARVRCVSEGVITAYVVRLPASGAPLLVSLGNTLSANYLFGHVEAPFQDTINRVVEDLALHTNSRLTPVDVCAVCGRLEPFPSEVMVLGEDGARRSSDDTYCSSCAVEIAAAAEPLTRARASAR